jgi:hypothetical protein
MLFSAEKIIYVTKSAADYIHSRNSTQTVLHNKKYWMNIKLQYVNNILNLYLQKNNDNMSNAKQNNLLLQLFL